MKINFIASDALKAFKFCETAHEGQTRDNGDPYFTHCVRVAEMVRLVNSQDYVISACYAHDILEDTDVSENQLVDAIGHNATTLVKELTQDYPDNMKFEDKCLYTFKYCNRMSKWASLIKLCDRIDNVSSMDKWKEGRRRRYLVNTLAVLSALDKWQSSLDHQGFYLQLKYLIEDKIAKI
jgi:GTP pyrophosphokinase